jgi:hypothetical protein
MELQCGMSPHAAYLVLLGRCTDFYPAHMQLMMQPRRAAMIARVMESISIPFPINYLSALLPFDLTSLPIKLLPRSIYLLETEIHQLHLLF